MWARDGTTNPGGGRLVEASCRECTWIGDPTLKQVTSTSLCVTRTLVDKTYQVMTFGAEPKLHIKQLGFTDLA